MGDLLSMTADPVTDFYAVAVTAGGAVHIDNETTGESKKLPHDSHAALLFRCLLREMMLPGSFDLEHPSFALLRKMYQDEYSIRLTSGG